MLPLLTTQQIRDADAYTIAHGPIASIDLMERASKAFLGWLINHFQDKNQSIAVYCGTGNNGGDGLAIARMLYTHNYNNVRVVIARFSDKSTDDFNTNFERLKQTPVVIHEIHLSDELPEFSSDLHIVALLGSGLNKPLSGEFERLVTHLNTVKGTIVAVDVPTGFPADGDIDKNATILEADLVITFQQPKINFLLPESAKYVKGWHAVNIGINENYITSLNSPYQFIQECDVKARLLARERFSNKGTYGHALIVAGQTQTMGAALLSSSACAHTGAGLTTACIPESGLIALNSYQPEVMALVRRHYEQPDIAWDKFNVLAVGPGLGKDEEALTLLEDILHNYEKPLVIDADALNMLAGNHELLKKIPAKSILTPHMKEFDRLFGEHSSWWQRLQTAKQKARELDIYIMLKNTYTITATPEGCIYFNSTGNPGMATGGMGDVLTGIITALLAQHYPPQDACLLGAYIHGKAADELALPNRLLVVLAGKLISQIPATMAKLLA